MIKAECLHKRFGDIQAVDGVSFEIPPGHVYGLLGPNGAGKTTTINMLVGVLKPDSGTVTIDGENDPMQPKLRFRIGNAPQSLALYDELTAEENLLFFGRLYGLAGRRLKNRVKWCLDLAGLQERKNSRVRTFSGGMKRRLNLSCALVHEPPILLLDEPTVGVDPQSRNLIFEKIDTFRREGLTVVYTTHYMEEAQRLCDTVAIMDNGKILASGTVDYLISKHGGKAVIQAELEALPDPSVMMPGKLEGMLLRFNTARPLEDIAALNSQGVAFRSLRVDRPDLESVFLNLTGRSLRD